MPREAECPDERLGLHLLTLLEWNVEPREPHDPERVARLHRPCSQEVIEGHLVVLDGLAEVHESDARHELGWQAAELFVVSRDGARGAAAQELGEQPARSHLTLAGIGAVQDLVEQEEDTLGTRRRVERELELLYLGVKMAHAALERIGDAKT